MLTDQKGHTVSKVVLTHFLAVVWCSALLKGTGRERESVCCIVICVTTIVRLHTVKSQGKAASTPISLRLHHSTTSQFDQMKSSLQYERVSMLLQDFNPQRRGRK
jgi:hypothetical protein